MLKVGYTRCEGHINVSFPDAILRSGVRFLGVNPEGNRHNWPLWRGKVNVELRARQLYRNGVRVRRCMCLSLDTLLSILTQ